MRCPEFLLRYDELEPGYDLPWRLKRHLFSCDECRASVARVEAAMAAWKAEEALTRSGYDESLRVERVMAAIRLTTRPRRAFSMRQWALSGLLLAFSGFLVPMALYFDGLGSNFDNALLFPLALAIGCSLVVFGVIFIGSHFEQLRDQLQDFDESRGRPSHKY